MLRSANADNLQFWLQQQEPQTLDELFGRNLDELIRTAKDFEPALGVNVLQTLVEVPLLGAPCADISFGFDTQDFRTNYFNSEAGRRIQPLFHYCSLLVEESNPLFIEIDTSRHNPVPGIFLDCLKFGEVIFDRLWQKGAEPPQWNRVRNLTRNLPDLWQLLYMGFMPNRQDIPLKLIFVRLDQENEYLPNIPEDVEALLTYLGHGSLPQDAQEKLNALKDLGFNKITLSMEMLPDGSFGPILGTEIFLPEDLETPQELLNTEGGQKLLRRLQDWQLADGRAERLANCCGIFFPPKNLQCMESQIQVFPNHIKLRWQEGRPLPAKAYLSVNSYFR